MVSDLIDADPARLPTRLPLSAPEAQILSNPVSFENERSLFSYLQELAKRQPDSLAIRGDDGGITYRDLSERVGRRAHTILGRGGRPGSPIVVKRTRGTETIVDFLAIEAIDAVYVPVDARWPAHRQGAVVDQVQPVLSIDDLWRDLDADWSDFDGPASFAGAPDRARYVIFTSGSTGVPKGAVVTHAGMMNHLHAKVLDLQLTRTDSIAQTAPVGFDISIWQMLVAVVAGASTVVIADRLAQDPTALIDQLSRHSVSVAELVPTVIRYMLEEAGSAERPERLRWMIATGEELPRNVAAEWLGTYPTVLLMNAYGPTECSDDVTHATISSEDLELPRLPIGTPIANANLLVLTEVDGFWQPVTRGEQGELFVEGVSVGLGYLRDEKRSGEAFFSSPLTAGSRMYRTGDLVRVRTDGQLTYEGRADRQVKVAGVRMEPGEIENVIGRAEGVTAVAVVALPSAVRRSSMVLRETSWPRSHEGGLVLHAFVTAERAGERDQVGIREFARGALTPAMTPQAFHWLDEMPLTPNGKVDIQRLESHARPWVGDSPARNDDQRIDWSEPAVAVLTCFRRVLGDDIRSVDQGFVEAGGDSLRAMQLLADLRRHDVQVALADLLANKSANEIAAGISRPVADEAGDLRSRSIPPGRLRHWPREHALTPQQAGIHFQWKLDPESPYYTYQGVLELPSIIDAAGVELAWQRLLYECPQLLARFVERDGPSQVMPYWPPMNLGLADADTVSYADFRTIASQTVREPFDLSSAPAIRLRTFRLPDGVFLVLFTMHEILLDGWGASVLFERFMDLYESAPSTNEADTRRDSFSRYVDETERRLVGSRESDSARYWAKALAGAPDQLGIESLTLAQHGNSSYRGEIVEVLLDQRITATIRNLCVEFSCTPFTVLLAGYAIALGYYTGSDDVVVGAPLAGRQDEHQDSVVGFLLNMTPLRLRPDPTVTVRDYLEMSTQTVRDGHANGWYPFQWIVEQTGGTRQNSTPVFQTMLNMLTYPSPSGSVDGREVSFTELDTGYTKYDCALYVQHHEDRSYLLQLAYRSDRVTPAKAKDLLWSTKRAVALLSKHLDDPILELKIRPTENSRSEISDLTASRAVNDEW